MAIVGIASPAVIMVGIAAPAVVAIVAGIEIGIPIPPGRTPRPAVAEAKAPVGAVAPAVAYSPVAAAPSRIVPRVPIGAVPRVPRIVETCAPVVGALATLVLRNRLQLERRRVLLRCGVVHFACQLHGYVVAVVDDGGVVIGGRYRRFYSFSGVGIVIFIPVLRLGIELGATCRK